jgi:hypothetical protein
MAATGRAPAIDGRDRDAGNPARNATVAGTFGSLWMPVKSPSIRDFSPLVSACLRPLWNGSESGAQLVAARAV